MYSPLPASDFLVPHFSQMEIPDVIDLEILDEMDRIDGEFIFIMVDGGWWTLDGRDMAYGLWSHVHAMVVYCGFLFSYSQSSLSQYTALMKETRDHTPRSSILVRSGQAVMDSRVSNAQIPNGTCFRFASTR